MAFVPVSTEQSVTVEEHVERVLGAVEPLPPYDQPLLEALGLPVCGRIVAPMDLPSFDNSGMDGYAVVVSDVVDARDEGPVQLPVVGEVAAGQSRIFAMSPGTAVKIMTGAPVPFGAGAVVPVEWTDGGAATVRIHRSPREGQNIRRQGEDIRTGDVLLEEGTTLGPRQLGLLASMGYAQVASRPRPRVVILSTGSELREPGTKLSRDAIYDANSFMLAAAVRSAGAIAYRVGTVPDEPVEFADALSDQLVRADLVVTSGGVSRGAYDVVKDVLARLGTVEFCEVAMQPGKPQGFGRVGEDETPIFTLPGNPVSAYVSFEVFVVPALRRLTGRRPYRRPLVQATLTADVPSVPGKAQYLRGRFEVGPQGVTVTPVGGPGSHLLGGLAHSNALVVLAEDVTAVASGETVPVLVLDRDF